MFESTLEPYQQKWSEMTLRDRRSSIILVASLIISLVIFLIILPLMNARTMANEDLASAQQTYDELLLLAPNAMSTSTVSKSLNANSLNSEIRRQAARHGVVIQRFEPDGERLKVWIEEVRYVSLIQWIGSLQSGGVDHFELSMEDRPAPGLVSARITFGVKN